jgi:hypothetical protein
MSDDDHQQPGLGAQDEQKAVEDSNSANAPINIKVITFSFFRFVLS